MNPPRVAFLAGVGSFILLAVGTIAVGEDSATVTDVPSGIYECNFVGAGSQMARHDGGGEFIFVGQRLSDQLGKVTIASLANDNSKFSMTLKKAGPVPAGSDEKYLAVIVAGACFPVWSHSDRTDKGTVDLGANIEGEALAKQVAAELKITPLLRQHPGHQLLTTFEPEKKSYAPGEHVTLMMTIKNVGKKPVCFDDGGRNRGTRNNQFGFTAYPATFGAQAIPDTGDPANGGGLVGFVKLAPGEVFTRNVDLADWFHFDKPDSYLLTGSFSTTLRYWTPFGIVLDVEWDEFAVDQCTVYVKDPNQP